MIPGWGLPCEEGAASRDDPVTWGAPHQLRVRGARVGLNLRVSSWCHGAGELVCVRNQLRLGNLGALNNSPVVGGCV